MNNKNALKNSQQDISTQGSYSLSRAGGFDETRDMIHQSSQDEEIQIQEF